MFSSILPRPVDHESNGEKVKDVNKDLMKLCEQRNIRFLHSYRPFLKFDKPIRELFAIKDHELHLNLEGLRRLRFFFYSHRCAFVVRLGGSQISPFSSHAVWFQGG